MPRHSPKIPNAKVLPIIQKYTSRATSDDYSSLLKLLNDYLSELKTYMKTENLETDTFMVTLCDDIYVCILGLNSELGDMFVYARSSSQEKERAYNLTNITRLHATHQRSGSAPPPKHTMSRNSTTCYATNGALNVMRTCSGSNLDTNRDPSQDSNSNNHSPIMNYHSSQEDSPQRKGDGEGRVD